jgi:hypothetical protein
MFSVQPYSSLFCVWIGVPTPCTLVKLYMLSLDVFIIYPLDGGGGFMEIEDIVIS